MAEIEFVTALHKRTARNYLQRALDDKDHCAEVASRFDQDYWDGDRRYGYGGMTYDGRWLPVAERIAEHYQLKAGQRVLDIGCGKGFLLHDLMTVVPGLQGVGLDLSAYALAHAHGDQTDLVQGDATDLPFADQSFDLVISIMTLHNLGLADLWKSLQEINRVSKGKAYMTTESYRNVAEKNNLLNWQLTCRSFYAPQDWLWLFQQTGYQGDWAFQYFE